MIVACVLVPCCFSHAVEGAPHWGIAELCHAAAPSGVTLDAAGCCRRVALYGVDALINAKKQDLKFNLLGVMDEEKIRLREEVAEQIRALRELKTMAAAYGDDISRPATNSREAVQWLYYAYLGRHLLLICLGTCT
jgi:hypothetical protein